VVVGGLALCGATAYLQRVQAQSPDVVNAVQKTGGKLLLASDQGASRRILVLGPYVPPGMDFMFDSTQCAYFEFEPAPNQSGLRGTPGDCVSEFLEFVDAPFFVQDMWGWVRVHIERIPPPQPGMGSPTPMP
jgi:hypothetical protein